MFTIESVAIHAVESVVRAYGFDGLLKLLRRSPDTDERITKLAAIQTDLEAAIEAVKDLQKSATASQTQANELQEAVERLKEDKKAAEDLVRVPEEAFARMLGRASAKGRGRGLLEGIAIGLFTGFASSLLAWWVTKP